MSTELANNGDVVHFAEVVDKAPTGEHLGIDDFRRVRVTITADLGEASLLVREVLDLKQGSIIPLNKLAGETTDIYVNGVALAKGEVVVIADAIHIRISEIHGLIDAEKETSDDEF